MATAGILTLYSQRDPPFSILSFVSLITINSVHSLRILGNVMSSKFLHKEIRFAKSVRFLLKFFANFYAYAVLLSRHLYSLTISATPPFREKGGAYGGGATGDSANQFKFYSYRDPSTVETVDRFDAAVQWALDVDNYRSEYVDEAKLSVFSKVGS